MDVSRQLITHVIDTGSLVEVKRAGIKADWITDPAARACFDFITEFYGTYSAVPSERVFAREYPNYELDAEPEPLPFVLDEMRKARALSIMERALYDASAAYSRGDVDAIRGALTLGLADLAVQIPQTIAVDITATGGDRLARYQELRANDGSLKGITTGFMQLDDALGGWRDGNLVVFAGRAKSGKSTFLLRSALAAWMAGKKIMFVGFEMSQEEQEERIDAVMSMVSHTGLRDGSLPEKEIAKVSKAIRQMELLPEFFLVTDTSATTDVSGIIETAKELKPDLVLIDGAYMMHDERGEDPGSNKALMHICAGLKFGALRNNLKILLSTQMLQSKMHGEEISLGSIGYTSAFQQYADAVIGVQVTDDPLISMIRLLAARNASPLDFYFYRDWHKGTFVELFHNPFGDDDSDGDDGTDRSAWYDKHAF